jgi:predicted DNA-binding transcriptional regulator AlpA
MDLNRVRVRTPRERSVTITSTAASAPIRPGHGIEPLLSQSDICRVLSCSQRSLDRLRASGRLPRPDLFIGRSPRWKAEAIRRWIDAQSWK